MQLYFRHFHFIPNGGIIIITVIDPVAEKISWRHSHPLMDPGSIGDGKISN